MTKAATYARRTPRDESPALRRRIRASVALALGWLALAACERPEEPKKTHEAARPDQTPQGERDARRPGAPRPGAPKHDASADMSARPNAGERASAKCLTVDPGQPQAEPVKKAVAVIAPAKGSKIKGTVSFEQAEGGLTMKADFEGLPPGKHAFHVHAYGDCSAEDASSAGPHFDFEGSFSEQGKKHITGDLGELQADGQGKAHVEKTVADATLQGPFTVIGRSIVVHEMGNDPTKPPEGGAGGRVGCGVIGIEH